MQTQQPRVRMARADRRDQLVAVAERVFVERGYGPASMDDLADAAGVTKPVLYDHFGSKDGLLAAVLERLGEELLADVLEATAGGSTPERQLSTGLLAYFRFVEQHRSGWALLLGEVAPGTAAAAAVDAVRRAQVAHIAGAVAAHLPHPDPALAEVYAEAVSGAAERLAAVRLTDPGFT
ncbi:MAG: TetR/AcrR family transcriptional regulator, partial [Mycobacteriales bacterium]